MTDSKYSALGDDKVGRVEADGAVGNDFEISVTKADKFDPEPVLTTGGGGGNVRKFIVGIFFGLGVCFSSVAATQFAKSTYSATFNGPFFTIWFSTTWMTLCYPTYLLVSYVFSPLKRKMGYRILFNEDQTLYGEGGLTFFSALKLNGPFLIMWVGTNYVFVRALGLASATVVTIIFSTNTAVVYILSWLLLAERVALIPAKTLSVLLSITGTVLVLYDGLREGDNLLGTVFLPLIAAFGAAFYKVIFKRVVGSASLGQVSLFLSLIGVLNFLLTWPILLTLFFIGQESWDVIPWGFLCGNAALAAVFNFLVNFGIAVTFPLLISLGHILGIPANGVIDFLFRGTMFQGLKIVGAVLVIVGFVVMVLPASVQEKLACLFFKRKTEEADQKEGAGTKETEPMKNGIEPVKSGTDASDV